MILAVSPALIFPFIQVHCKMWVPSFSLYSTILPPMYATHESGRVLVLISISVLVSSLTLGHSGFSPPVSLTNLTTSSNLVNISSTNGIDSFYPYSMDYDASKAGVISLTHNLSTAFAPNIRVNAIAPGYFWTALQPACWEKEKIPTLGADAPMKRAGQTYELAPIFVYLASDDSSYVTGQTMHINGGLYKG